MRGRRSRRRCRFVRLFRVSAILISDHVVAFFSANFLLLVVRCRSDLQVGGSTEAIVQGAIDLTGNGCREMMVSISATRDNDHGGSRISERCIRREQSNPAAAAAVTCSSLSRNCLQRIIGASTGTVVN